MNLNLKIEDFNYELSQSKIAQYPLEKRDESKILVYKNKEISEDIFYNIDKYIDAKSLMVFNDTKVIRARIFFYKSTGAEIEILLLEPAGLKTFEEALSSYNSCQWICIIGNASKWKHDSLKKQLKKDGSEFILEVERKPATKYTERNYFNLEFRWNRDISFSEVLEIAADVPLPPYLHRKAEEKDIERYQTIYADVKGSVAAPTSGLHFSEDVLKKLKEKNIKLENITLHIGAGTFKPVKSKTISGHKMHSEKIFISKTFLENLLSAIEQTPIISVGTTSMRAVESLYWLAKEIHNNKYKSLKEDFKVTQWQPYNQSNTPPINRRDSLSILLEKMDSENLKMIKGETEIIIMPGYEVKYFDALITNFHLPESTLLLLISAFVGDKWREIYDYALMSDFRFLSYGDSSILFK